MNDSQRRNLLIITYEFPPSAGGGVQRMAKFARYLPDVGWQPYVLCATPQWGRPTDESLLAEVAHVEVRRLPDRSVAAGVARAIAPLKRLGRRGAVAGPVRVSAAPLGTAAGGDASEDLATGVPVSTRIMRSLFLDSAALWAGAVPAAAERWHDEARFDAILASGPPHSALVAGAATAERLGVPYVVDMRDAWRENPGYRWPASPRLDARSLAAERRALGAAAAVLAVSEPIAREALEEGATRAIVVPNGFDGSELPRWDPRPGPLRVAFMGRFYGSTDPTPFFDGAALAVARGGAAAELVVDVLGQVSSFTERAVASRGLEAHVVRHGFRPHAEALALVARADVGLVALTDHPGAEANYTGKLFEYLGIGLPVLLVGPSGGVAAALINEARAGVVVPYGNAEAVADALERLAADKAAGARPARADASVVSRYDRRRQVTELASLLAEVAGSRRG